MRAAAGGLASWLASPRRPIARETGGTWTSVKPIPVGANEVIGANVNGRFVAYGGCIYVAGGRVGSAFVGGSSNISANEEYDIAKDTWRPRALMPTPRSGCVATALDGKLHVIGGESVQRAFTGVFDAHEVYDPATNAWSVAQSMPTARHAFAIATINGRIYTTTGMTTPGTGGGPATGAAVTEVFSW